MNDKTKILYDQLTKDGYDIGDYNSFSNNVKDDNKRKNLYNAITKDGYDVGDYDTFSAKLVGNSQPTGVNNVTTTPQPTNTEETFVQNPKVRERILANTPDYFKSKGNNLSTLPLGTNIQDANDIAQEEQQRVALAERSANDPYMRQQELEHVFEPKNQEQINAVNKMIADARRQRAEERTRNAKAVKSDGIFSTLSQAYVAGEQNDTDKQLEYASSLMEEAQNITNEAKKKGNTNFFTGFARGFKDAPLDGWAMGLQDLKNYSAAKKVLDKVDKGEQLNPAEDALMQALVTNAATKMYYSGDLGRGYKAGGVTAESLPFMLDMIAGMGAIQAVTKPASKALVKYATEKAAKYGLGKATTGLAKGAARTITGLGDVAAHTATFGGARVAADYQRRGMGDIQVSPNMDGTVSYTGRDNVQTGAEAIAKSAISTAAETGTELLGEYFSPMLGWVGKVTGANKIGKIIPASVGKAYSNIVNSQGFKNIQELAQRAKIADPIGEYGEEVVNNLISTAIGDMTPEGLVDLDQNIDTFLGVAPMSVLFGAASTGGYLKEKYKNYRDMRTFENQMQETMGEDWSGVKEALQDADIETARDMVKDVLSSDMQPDMKKRAINYISSVLQEQTLQEIDKQQMPEQIAAAKKSIISNMQKAKDTLLNQGMSESDISRALNESFVLSNDEMEEKYGLFKAYDIYDYRNAYTDYADYNYWVQNKAYEARKEAESQVEKMTNATTGTVMRVNSGLSKNPVNVLRGNIVFDNDGNVDQNQSDNTIYYLADDGKVKMAPISMFQSLVDDTPAEGLAQQAGQDAEEEVLQGEEAQINSTPEGQQQQIEIGTRFNQGGNNYEVTSKAADGYVVAALDEEGNQIQSQLVPENDLINAINSQNQVQPEQPVAQPDMNAQPQEGQTVQTEQPATQQTPDQPATAMSRIPLNEKGEQDFEKAPVEDTSAALIEISDSIDDAKDTAQQMIDSYNNELKKADKAKTTGSSIQEIVRLKQEKKANLQAINDKIAYWNKVASQIESQRPGGIIAQAEEEAKANQQRLDNMTQEQQQAAQQEVQKKIESGAYEKKQPRKRVRYVKEDSDMGESVTPLEHVLREIATGRVTFNWNDSGTTQGLGSHLGLASSPEERKKLIWALSSDGMTPEAAAEQIHADMPENLQGMVTDQDIFNMILNSFQEYGSPSKMWEEAKRMHGTDIEENIPGYKEDVERRQLEWEAGYNGMTVSEWIDYCDYIEEKINDMYSSVSDEELNTIFEQIYNEYEQRRTETESAGSTEGQPDGKQGDEVLPASESDNAGTGAEVEEQPQPANQVDGESGSVVPEPEGTVKTDIEKAREDVDQNPTEAQKEAGNYKKGHVKIDGYDVTIENPKGSVRSGKDANGNEWSVTMNNDYGYIRGTEGVDGDHIDVFLSDNPESGDVFVIDQVNPDGSFDEHKVMYGFKSALAAKRAYLANYSKGWTGLGNITRVSKEEFKKWIDSSNRKTKPFAEYKSVKPVNKNKKVNDNITEKDIQDSPFEQITKDGALAYLRGNVNFATSIAYQQIYNYVRNRSGNNQSDSGAGNPAQPTLTVDETTRRESRPDGVQAGEVARENDNSSSSQNSKKLDLFPDGEGSDTGLRGKESSNDGVSSGDTGRKRCGRTGSNGRNVRKRAGERISKSPVKSNPERGGNSTSSERDGIIDEINSLLDDFVKAGNETASLSVIGMNPKQIEIAGKLLVAGVRLGYTYIKDGITKFNDWMDAMKEKLSSPFSSAMKLTDAEIDEFIKDMWEYPHTINGETRPLKVWASIMEADTLRNSVRSSLEDKRKLQEDAENIPVKVGDKANIVETLPYLLPQQQDDVFRAETQFFDQSHNDRDHAFGKGYLFTNGTGTGKTYTGLGIAKRFIKQGKDRILILTPSQAKVNDWINDAKNLGINLTALESTKDKGTGPVITTFANLRTNKELMKDAFDLVIYDESHRIMENKKGEETAGAKQHYMLTNKNVDEALRRIQLNHPLWIKEKELLDELKDVEDQINPGKNPPEKISEYKGKRKELSSQLIELQRKQKEVLPEMENQAKEDVKRTKVVFLSATPFNTIPSLSYAEGYIFSYPEENKNTVGSYNHRSPRALFLEQNFGAGYKWRYGGIENSIENPEALSRQEVQFSDYLENVLGTKSGRIIDSEYDYSRDFPTVTFDMAPLFNQAIEDVIRNEELNILYDAFSKVFFDYNYSTALFETMKIAAIMPRIRKHLEMGRKVVVFHRRVESKTPLQPPFELSLQIAKEQASEIDTTTEDGKEKKKQFFKAIMLFRQKYGKLLYYEQKMNYSMPRKQVADAFGADNVLFFSGNESKTYKNNAIKQFNDDNSGKDIIVIQESSGKEGISLHDTTGKHQRVLITLALPQSPITALQIEGRIYRIGNKSNAIFEYPLLGLNLEKILFGKQFNNQVSTTENLALGSKARNLRDSFAEGVVSNSGDVPLDRQGVGGKEFDNKGKEKTDAFDNSISDYYGTQKLRPGRNNRSGFDYFPTPEPVGYKMVEWARLSENEDVLEPSAGHGAIARYVPKSNGLTAIEPSTDLFPILQLRAGGQGRKFVDTMFENYNLVNKFDAVLMNPPYGTAGRTAIDHLQKAFNHLNEGGRVIAIIPRGSADSKFDKWYESEKGAYLVGEVLLPSVTFNRAGTSVSTRIVVIDKVTRPEAAKKVPSISRYDLSEITDIDGNDGLFEAIRNIQMPERTIDQTGIDIKNAKKTLKDFKDIKSVYEADVDEQGVTVRGTYGMNFVQTFENIRKPAVYYAYKKSLDELRKESDQKANVGRSVQERISFLDTVLATIRNVSGKTEEQIMEEQSKNANSSKLDTLYEFVPDKDTRNNNDIYLARPYNKGQLSKDQYREIANLAKKNNGYWSSFKKAFLFNSESDARSFLNEDLNSDENGIRFREDNTRSIIDPFINDLMKEYAGEDLSRYPFEDKRTDPNNDYNVYWGYSEPLYNGKNIDGNEEVPEVIRDIIRNDEYEIDKQNIIDTLKRYIEFNEGFDEELEYKKVLGWFQENKDKFSMSPKVNLIVDRDSIPDNLYRVEEKDDAKTSEEVKSVSEKLNVPVEVVTSPDQIKDQSVRKAIESGRKVKGWYSISEGKVYLYLPNATSMEDAVQTLLHEGVAHYGLRRLVGEEKMDDFLDDIFTNASKEVRQRIIDTLSKYGYNSRIATEEYMARMAEKGVDDVSFWDRIKQAFKNLLRRIGINISINDNELRYILWRSRQNLNMERPIDMAKDVAMQYQMGVGNYYRDDTSDGSREAYENSLQGWRYKAREAYQDSMLALKNLQDVVAKVSGKPIQGFENAYIAENQLSSRNTTEARRYNEKFFKPLMDAEGKLIKKYGLTHKAIERYMMLAHGIERNVEMTFREQLNDVIKNNPDDAEQFAEDFRQEKKRLRGLYSGYQYLKELTDYIGEVGDYSATKAILQSMDNENHDSFQDDALDYVKDFENTYDVKELWDKTNKATKETLRKSYESGMMSKDHFANVSNMFMYYVPLRGWNEQTAEDVYDYINSERTPINSVLKKMKGRSTPPDEIMATIGNMAESAIVQGNRNLMKQAFMNMVMNHPTDLATLKKAWYVYDPATDEWNISFPDIEENDTPETIAQKIQDHEDIMKKLKDQGIATQKSSRLNINYKITKGNVKQHVVQVKNGGKDYLIYVNANPRAAQAINGLTNPDTNNKISTLNRWLAANFTTRNPAFVMSNLSRDIIFSMAAINIKEDGKYSARFRKNIFKAMPVIMRNLRGNDKGTESDKYFKEFIENGGETGYMHLTDVNEYKKKVRQELRKITGKQGSARAAFDYTLERLEDFNRWAEDVSRFSVYMTSRQMGRSIVESINDAKEVTVNFNKKGAGYKTGGFFGITAGAMRIMYLFFNASVQSLTNFNRLRVKNPTKFYSTLGGFMAAGFLMPLINNFFHNIFGDGDDPYNDLPEWVRRNNLCIYASDGKFVTIPLPIELRAFYGLGDYAYQLFSGKEKPNFTGISKGTIGQLADLLPLNPLGNEGIEDFSIKTAIRTLTPDFLSPISDAYLWNEDFTGKPIAKLTPFNERDPEWKRVYKGTSGWLVDTSKFLNDLTNGDEPGKEFRKGFIDFNPAKVENLFESYFGGMAKFLNQAGKTIYYGSKSLIEGEKDDNLIMRNVPVLNRFGTTVDERNAFSGINTEYFKLRDEMDQFKYELNGVKKNFRKNPDEYRQMVRSDMFQKYMKYRPYQKILDKLYQMGKEQEGEERKQTEDMITETRRELLQAVK